MPTTDTTDTANTFDYAPANAAIRRHVRGTAYAARKHSHRQVMAHVDHATEWSTVEDHMALCCHTCRVMVAY